MKVRAGIKIHFQQSVEFMPSVAEKKSVNRMKGSQRKKSCLTNSLEDQVTKEFTKFFSKFYKNNGL